MHKDLIVLLEQDKKEHKYFSLQRIGDFSKKENREDEGFSEVNTVGCNFDKVKDRIDVNRVVNGTKEKRKSVDALIFASNLIFVEFKTKNKSMKLKNVRGWNIESKEKDSKKIFAEILKKYNINISCNKKYILSFEYLGKVTEKIVITRFIGALKNKYTNCEIIQTQNFDNYIKKYFANAS